MKMEELQEAWRKIQEINRRPRPDPVEIRIHERDLPMFTTMFANKKAKVPTFMGLPVVVHGDVPQGTIQLHWGKS
jgi:hypothetical protein